jgi:gliding motility-associated-like protein
MIRISLFTILILCLFSLAAKAQTCAGSLGDPVINETFGTGNYQLSPDKTTYTYTGGCPSKETYTTSGFLFGCGNKTWVQMVGDHTPGDLNGNYMMVNAESTPGIVYKDTAKDLCGNTTYQFGMWVTSVMTKYACGGHAVLPNLKYQIKTLSGVTLASDSTGDLPIVEDREWKFYGLSLTTPSNISDAIVSITIDPAYGCGSGFALDDISLRPCGPSISATIDGTTGPAEVCADYTNPFIMNASYSPGFADPVLQWQESVDTGKTWVDIPGETTRSYAIPHRTSAVILYRVSIAERININSPKCRITSNAIYTNIHPLPEHVPPQNMPGCLGKNFFLPPADPKALDVLWTGPNGYNSIQPNSSIPNIQDKDTGLYTLKETFSYNCVSLDTFYLKVFPGTTISVEPSYPICEGRSEQLFASATDSVGYKWIPSTGLSNDVIPNPVASPSDSTNYKVLITNKYGCKDSASLQIDVYRNPFANAGPDKTILSGDTAILNASVKGTAVNFTWSPSTFMNDSRLITPHVFPPVNATYSLQVVSTVGCGSASDNVLVKVYNNFYVPNAFTPNGDGKNDKFEILTLDNYKLTSLLIYNRWGQVVFESRGSYKGWDGMFKGLPQPQGIYVYRLEMQAPSRGKIIKKGTVLLIR